MIDHSFAARNIQDQNEAPFLLILSTNVTKFPHFDLFIICHGLTSFLFFHNYNQKLKKNSKFYLLMYRKDNNCSFDIKMMSVDFLGFVHDKVQENIHF